MAEEQQTEQQTERQTEQQEKQQTERQKWMATLAKAPVQELETLFAQVKPVPDYRFLRSPETGLTMVRGRAGGVGQVFNLGEMSLTRCVVQLFAGAAEPIAGFGYVGGRSHRHAELAALCDGLLQHAEWHQEIAQKVVEPLRAIALKKKAQQQQQTAATKVDFFTMLRGE
ncbi:MAG: phosphonate C-P lyase system protein PhnG [Cyanobacteria bacterium J06560_2]